ncbi:hypothetical protein ES703_18311 [subsurface metagenome]
MRSEPIKQPPEYLCHPLAFQYLTQYLYIWRQKGDVHEISLKHDHLTPL